MTAYPPLRRWSSLASPPIHAVEIASAPCAPRALAGVLASITAEDLADSAFLVIRLGPIEGDDIQRAVEAVNQARVAARICLAVDRATLRQLDVESLDAERVGLMLDDVDAGTPLCDLASDIIEAVRFRAEFVALASRDLRLGCALDAMLGFAKDLGLCTLGPAMASNDASFAARAEFDYVPVPLAVESVSPEPPQRSARAEGRALPVPQLSR